MNAKRVVIAYALLGAAGILLLDQLLGLILEPQTSESTPDHGAQTWLFVGTSALLLYLLLNHLARRFTRTAGELAAVKNRLNDYLEVGSDWQCEMGPDLRFAVFSDRFGQATGIDPSSLVGRRRGEVVVPELDQGGDSHARDLGHHRAFRDVTYPLVDEGGRISYARVSGKPVFDDRGGFQGYRVIGTDVTATVEAQDTQARLAAILQVTPDVVATADAGGRVQFLNSAARQLAGVAEGSALPELQLVELLAPATAEQLDAEMLPHAGQEGVWSGEGRLRGGDGREVPALLTVLAHKRGDGTVTYYSLVARDLSERQETEARFARSRRLEAIGQLSAGIAHDFNNLLLVILGNAEILDASRHESPRVHQAVTLIRQASTRAAELTDRLLTFARQRPLKPQPVRLERMVQDMQNLLQRSLGEEVQVSFSLDALLGPVFVDRSELETTILNLAINARDAMPRGGRLTIEAQNAEFDAEINGPVELKPGRYVVIAVSDTGTGMSRETLERACEPFFTTKGPGHGTGLGLAMAFGFARQSGGHLTIYSELGRGTTIRLYLPRHQEEAPLRLAPAAAEMAPLPCGQERVLLVEDEPLVRQFVESQLLALGYRVASAGNGEEAVGLLQGDRGFDLLLTDIVMPGALKGPDLAAEARLLLPGIKVIYTTGYAQQAALAQADLPADSPVLSKPYRRATLARMLRGVLDKPEAVEAIRA